jgi:hypothetical protein
MNISMYTYMSISTVRYTYLLDYIVERRERSTNIFYDVNNSTNRTNSSYLRRFAVMIYYPR